jgi:hypothetical protein
MQTSKKPADEERREKKANAQRSAATYAHVVVLAQGSTSQSSLDFTPTSASALASSRLSSSFEIRYASCVTQFEHQSTTSLPTSRNSSAIN